MMLRRTCLLLAHDFTYRGAAHYLLLEDNRTHQGALCSDGPGRAALRRTSRRTNTDVAERSEA